MALLLAAQEAVLRGDALATGGAVAVAMALVRSVEALAAKMGKTGKVVFGGGDRAKLEEMHRWHAPTPDGRQEWKNPDVRDILAEIRDTLQRMERQDRGGP